MLREDPPAQLPTRQPGGLLPDEMAPDDLEKSILPKPEQPAAPLPMQVRTADASGAVPIPEKRPAEPAPLDMEGASPQTPPDETGGAPAGPLVNPNDSRYGDDHWLVMNYVLTQGALPWLQAASDVASGKVPPEDFDKVRIEHSKRVQAVVDAHPDFVEAAQKAVPLLEGLGISIFKPAASVAGTVARGAGAGAVTGAVQGGTSGDPETPTLSSERASAALQGGAEGAVLGAAGAAGAEAGKGIVKGAKAVSAGKATDTAARNAADQAETRKQAVRDKAQARRDEAKQKSATTERQAGEFLEYKKVPGQPGQNWKHNRELFEKDPTALLNHYSQNVTNPSLAGFSREVNLPQAVVAARLNKFDLNANTQSLVSIQSDITKVMAARDAFRARAATTKEPPQRVQRTEDVVKPSAPQREKMIPDQTPSASSEPPYRGPALERRKQDVGEPSTPISRPPYQAPPPKRKSRAKK